MKCKMCHHDSAKLRSKITGLVSKLKPVTKAKFPVPSSGLTPAEAEAWGKHEYFRRRTLMLTPEDTTHWGINCTFTYTWSAAYHTYVATQTPYFIDVTGKTSRRWDNSTFGMEINP